MQKRSSKFSQVSVTSVGSKSQFKGKRNSSKWQEMQKKLTSGYQFNGHILRIPKPDGNKRSVSRTEKRSTGSLRKKVKDSKLRRKKKGTFPLSSVASFHCVHMFDG